MRWLCWQLEKLRDGFLRLLLGPSPAEILRSAYFEGGQAMVEGLKRGFEIAENEPSVASLEEFLERVSSYEIFGPNRPLTLAEQFELMERIVGIPEGYIVEDDDETEEDQS